MKTRFTTLDLIAILPEIREKLIGMRVNQVYDVDSKTFILRFSKSGQENIEEESIKQMLILESGIRVHLTEFNWPKNSTPSGFTMKLRKHLRNKRLEKVSQLGVDRIIDLQFGTKEFANHIIIELYSKGNILLTDEDYKILSLLRFYKDHKTNINIATREKYPVNKDIYIAGSSTLARSKILEIMKEAKVNHFKKVFNPYFPYGPTLLEHSLLNFKEVNLNKFTVNENDIDLLEKVFQYAEQQIENFKNCCSKGYIIQKTEKRSNSDVPLIMYEEFHPFLSNNFKSQNAEYQEYDSFNKAVDLFFSNMEGQKIESKAVQQEKQALKKLEAIKKDHVTRLENLSKKQEVDNKRAQLIESNIDLVDKTISVLRSAIANKYSWEMIAEMVKDAQDNGDLIASKIKELKLEKNSFQMLLDDPYDCDKENSMIVDIDIGLSAFANARKYYENRKDAAKKEQKTIDHSEKAFKNVERKVKQQLKETSIKTNIVLARKILWFEKFYWFISSEGYLIIAGRDAQQNELIVKRYLDKKDVYVHADIHGATSVLIKNHTDSEIPPKTLNEAANMAVCYSASWEAKVVTNAYWVYSHQVQKTAPSGQFLTVGSFMIRGKKNYIPLQNLVLGFGFLFRIGEESIEKRQLEIKGQQQNELEHTDPSGTDEKPKSSMETEEFPDTIINVCPSMSESANSYTIVTTGDMKRKSKIITERTLTKKQIQQKKNIKNEEKRKMKKTKNAIKEETRDNLETPPVVSQEEIVDSQVENVSNDIPVEIESQNELTNGNSLSEVNEEKDTDAAPIEAEEDDDEDNENDSSKKGLDTKKIIDSLVPNPLADDILLYAIPMCGPYSSMNSFKYKVKLTPGSTKRGKASKTALMIFLKEKTATQREKDLLKAIKDQDIAKNMPGKVKLISSLNAIK